MCSMPKNRIKMKRFPEPLVYRKTQGDRHIMARKVALSDIDTNWRNKLKRDKAKMKKAGCEPVVQYIDGLLESFGNKTVKRAKKAPGGR